MINIKKGTAHSLQQSDFTGSLSFSDPFNRVPTVNVTAGQIVSVTGAPTQNTDGSAVPPPIVLGLGALTDKVGFAVTNTNEGDAIESQRVGAIALDGNSVIETDQVVSGVTLSGANFPYGAPVYAIVGTGATAGFVTNTSNTGANKLVGTVDGIRAVFVGQTAYTLLGIKLAAQ
jgi:hypothetical protein